MVFVVIGGGIAGVSCAQELAKVYSVEVLLITASNAIKESGGVMKITGHLEEFAVYERTVAQFRLDNPLVSVMIGKIASLCHSEKNVQLCDGTKIGYDKLCICSGAESKLFTNHPQLRSCIYGLRDIDSAVKLAEKLRLAKRVAIVGNGGIALELVNVLDFCEVHWIIRDKNIGSIFFDSSASSFLLPTIASRMAHYDGTVPSSTDTVWKPSVEPAGAPSTLLSSSSSSCGFGIGPDWILLARDILPSIQRSKESNRSSNRLVIHDDDEVVAVKMIGSREFLHVVDGSVVAVATELIASCNLQSQYVLTKKNELVECDVIISATGVQSQIDFVDEAFIKDQQGILVDKYMQTSVSSVFAAGDCCTCLPSLDNLPGLLKSLSTMCEAAVGQSIADYVIDMASQRADEDNEIMHWFQMKLWTQARLMGMHAAHCMYTQYDADRADRSKRRSRRRKQSPDIFESVGSSSIFDIFSHITRFFDYKVVLLGRFNAQGLVADETGGYHVADDIRRDQAIEFQIKRIKLPVGSESSDINSSAVASVARSKLEIWMRSTPNVEYVKVVVYDGKVIGCLLIGDTDLEEVMENLILNRFDVGAIGIDLLDPAIDIGDYFD